MPEHDVYHVEQRLLLDASAEPLQGQVLDATSTPLALTPTPLSVRDMRATAARESSFMQPEQREAGSGTTEMAGSVGLLSGIRELICSFPWPCDTAFRIVECETGGTFDTYAIGRYGERGLMQIHPIHFGRFEPDRLFEPGYNVWAAYQLWLESGWSPWECY